MSQIDPSKLSHKELQALKTAIDKEFSARKPSKLRCPECDREFEIEKVFSGQFRAGDNLMRHLRRVHRYPEEDASLTLGIPIFD